MTDIKKLSNSEIEDRLEDLTEGVTQYILTKHLLTHTFKAAMSKRGIGYDTATSLESNLFHILSDLLKEVD